MTNPKHQVTHGGDAATKAAERKPTRHASEEFIQAALKVCEEVGPECITARRIASVMDLSPMALYRHFESMEHLLVLAWNEAFIAFRNLLQSKVAQANRTSLEEFRETMTAYVEFGVEHPNLFRFMFSPGPRPGQFGLEDAGTVTWKFFNRQFGLLKAEGLLRKETDPESALLLVHFALNGLTTVAISGQAPKLTGFETKEIVQRTIDQLLKVL